MWVPKATVLQWVACTTLHYIRDQGRPPRLRLGSHFRISARLFMIESSEIAPTLLSNFLPTTVVRTGLPIWLLTLGQNPLTSVALGSSVSRAAQFRTLTTSRVTAAYPALICPMF